MRYRLADGAPEHYAQGHGIVKEGGEFEHDGPPPTEWCIPVEAEDKPVAKTVSKKAK